MCVCVRACVNSGNIDISGMSSCSVQSSSDVNFLQNVTEILSTSLPSCLGAIRGVHTSPAPCYLMENPTIDGTFFLFLLNEKEKNRKNGKKTKTTVWGHTNLNNHDILCQMSINVRRKAQEGSILLYCRHSISPLDHRENIILSITKIDFVFVLLLAIVFYTDTSLFF